jgi:DeoR/GlpR family transcriptional regulator of sugar metabolism
LFAQERHREILNILHKEGKVIVKDLSTHFNVTEDCIRKDLKILENEDLLERTYGGAVIVRQSAHMQGVEIRKSLNAESKTLIAKKTFDIIEENETVFLDISTTNILLAEKLSKSKKKLTVVTNMLDIISVLNNEDNNVRVISTGGILSKDLDGFIGSATIESILNYKPDKCFIGSCGVNIFDKSVTTFDVEDGNTKKAVIKSSKKVYLVMENSKFYFDGTYKFATLYDIDTIITETAPDNNIINLLGDTDTNIV